MVQTMRASVVTSLMLAVVCTTMLGASAVQHKVGGDLGWNYPLNQGPAYFAEWAAQNEFHVGDSLSFEQGEGTHNVVQVDPFDYETCTPNRALRVYSANTVVVSLSEPGAYYYICGINGHCEHGMKVALTVT